ncbi:MAG: hypothetical protein PHO45_02855, partial [Victivallaceae bacterium]|nr:hypothetical protein [Victivallaceae bacterium]
MATNYIYTLTDFLLPTGNDMTLLSNAPGFTDRGQVVIGYEWNTVRYFSCSIDLTGSDARLTVGGNLNLNSDGSPVTSTITTGRISSSSENILPLNANVYYKGFNIRDDAAAVRFRQNGVLFLNSHTGAKTANQYYPDGVPAVRNKSDDNMRIIAENVTNRSIYNSYDYYGRSSIPAPIPNNTTTSTIEVGGNLTVGGDLSGTIGASSSSFLHGINIWSSDKYIETDTTASQTNVANGIKTGKLLINNNQRAQIYADASVDMMAYTKPSITGNTMSAIGINASGTVSCANGQWAGEITATNSNNVLSALLDDIIVVNGASAKVTQPGAMTGNSITAIGLNAGGAATISEMIGSNWGSYNFQAEADNNSMLVEAAHTDRTSISFSNNTIHSYAINAAALTINKVSDEVRLEASSNNNYFYADILAGGGSVTVSSNNIEAAGINAASLNTVDFHGNIDVLANDSSVYFSGGTITYTNNFISANGIKVSGALTASNNFGGTISVEASRNNMRLSQYCEVYGIKADTITVTGRIDSGINVTSNDNVLLHYNAVGIGVKNLVADAFSGTMRSISNSAGIGISAEEEVKSHIAGDAFDINGAITASVIGILAHDTMNFRVSGSIQAQTAIMGEYYFNSKNNTVITNPSGGNADRIELSATAEITGDIDLGRGENNITINSGAKMDGALLADLGKMNIQFILDGAAQADRAIVNTGTSDISLTSPAIISVNLNYAENNNPYTLFEYNTVNSLHQYWDDKQITFIYKGQTKVIPLENGRGECYFGSTRAEIWYDDVEKKVFVRTTGVTASDPFGGQTAAVFTANSKTMNFTWERNALAAAFEVEYSFVDSNGNPIYGKSIVQRIVNTGGTKNSCTIEGINPGDRVKWRIRSDMDNGATVSEWTNWTTTTTSSQPLGTNVDMSNSTTIVLNPDDAGSGITSAIAKFTWAEAVSDNPIKNYTVEYFVSQSELLPNQVAAAFSNPLITKNTKIVSSKEAVVSSLIDQSFVYWRVKANDVNGNDSDWRLGESFRIYVGDYGKPVFIKTGNKPPATMSYTYDRTNAYDVKINVTFSWNEAYDSQAGVKYYLVEYKLRDALWVDASRIIVQKAETNPSGDYRYNISKELDGALYDYRISAVDYVGNQSEFGVTGSFGDNDVTPPIGNFSILNTPVVSAVWNETQVIDEITGLETTVRKLESARVDFSWSDTYTDVQEVLYKIQFSD